MCYGGCQCRRCMGPDEERVPMTNHMTWTTTRPTQPGWYWVRWPKSPQFGPEIRELVQPDGPDTNLWVDTDYTCPLDEYIKNHGRVEWQGPLEPTERDERETQP